MKTSVLLSGLALACMAMTACSNESVLDEAAASKTIGFRSMVDKESRGSAGAITTSNIDFFRVFGYFRETGSTAAPTNIFDYVGVTKNASSVWEYDNLAYWAANKDYYFMAFSTNVMGVRPWTYTFPTTDVDTKLAAFDTNKGIGTLHMSNAGDGASYQPGVYDLVYAYATRTTDATISNSSNVNLSFNHLMSRVRFKLTNGIANSAYSIDVNNVKLTNTTAEGTYTFANPMEWTAGSGTTEINFPNDGATMASGANWTSPARFILPGTQNLHVSFDATIYVNGTQYTSGTVNVDLGNINFEIGHSYQFTASLNEDNISDDDAKPIKFSVTSVANWEDWSDTAMSL